MHRAVARDAARQGLFYFRKSLVPEDEEENGEEEEDQAAASAQATSHENEYTLMNIDTIINGKVIK